MPDIIDSRDLLQELRDLLEDPHYDYSDDPADLAAESEDHPWTAMDDADKARVEALRDILSELPESTVDSPHGNSYGATLIHEDYFETYARELADDIAIEGADRWPNYCIDWERAANEPAMDYTTVTWEGETYLAR
jgi:hypothetical protein